MAKTSFQLIPPELLEKYSGVLSPADRFVIPRVRRQVLFSSRKRIKGMTLKSLMPQIAVEWEALTEGQRTAWGEASEYMGWSGWRLYFQDKAARIREAMEGNATPSLIHQSFVGKIEVAGPTYDFLIQQAHPRVYWVERKVRGFDRREPVRVVEVLSLPLTIKISYRTDLVHAGGPAPLVRYFAEVFSFYQGRTISQIVQIPFDLSSGWTRAEATLSGVIGVVKNYNMYIQAQNVEGTIEFDNVEAYHTGQNWARDPFCRSIRTAFTRVYFQVPRHWAPIELPDGSFYNSIYPLD